DRVSGAPVPQEAPGDLAAGGSGRLPPLRPQARRAGGAADAAFVPTRRLPGRDLRTAVAVQPRCARIPREHVQSAGGRRAVEAAGSHRGGGHPREGGGMNLLERVDALIDARHLLTHPFYQQWVAGTLPMDAMRGYAGQYFAFESSFPRFLSALHSRSDRADVRGALLENLWDEEHGESNHQELWLRFAEGIGVPRGEVR